MSAFAWPRIPAMPCRPTSRPSGTVVASAVGVPSAYVLGHFHGIIETISGQDRADQITNAMQVRSDREAGLKVVGVGSCGLDYLAVVARYPEPDTKLRTENLEVRAQLINGHDQ